MLLEGKSAVITGAGSGVGRAAARIFARNGARIVCADVANAANEETAAMVCAEGGQAVAVYCDVTDRVQVEAAIARAVIEYGRLDIMYNNVGVTTSTGGRKRTLQDTGDDEFDLMTNVNFRGVFNGCRAAMAQFVKQADGKGVIVNTGSVAGMVGWGGVIYGATKGAVNQITRGLAIEAAPHGVRVNAVCPAGMVTGFGREGEQVAAADLSAIEERYGQQHPLGRPISPDDAANAALFLASDLAANITGVALPVDGGYVAA